MKTIFFCLLVTQICFGQPIELTVNHEFIGSDTNILVKSKQKTLFITIAAPKNYSFQFAPYDTSWYYIRDRVNISYNQLPGGKYTLKIRDKYNKINRLCTFKVAQPFWLSWFFLSSMLFFIVMVLGMIIYFFLLYKFRQQAKLQKVRNDIAADLHDDMGATLTSIGFFGELIRKKIINRAEPSEILPLLSKVIDSSKESVETMRGVVWTINPNNDFALDFFEKLKYYASEMLSTKQVELSFEVEGVAQQELGIEVQRNLFLFFKEAINNILKHAKAKTTTVKIKMQSRKFWMEITDDGLGFDTNESFDGHGLGSLRKRIENLNGTLEIRSKTDGGTALEVTIFLP